MKKNHFLGHITVFWILVCLFSACNTKKPMEDPKFLTDTDRYYSSMSAAKGMNVAFISMFDSAGVLLRPNHMPIIGIEAIKTILKNRSDTSFSLTWDPLYGKISNSGDLGYTYGTFKLTDKKSLSTIEEGTYATIWQKQASGKWKAILDIGNEGLGNKK